MSKKLKTETEVAKEDEVFTKYFEEIEKVNEDLAKINEEIAKKQAAIGREYEPKKKPFYKKRAEIVSNIANFWSDAVRCKKLLMNFFFFFFSRFLLNVFRSSDVETQSVGQYHQ